MEQLPEGRSMSGSIVVTDIETAELGKWSPAIHQMAVKEKRGFYWIEAGDLGQEGKKALLLAMRSYNNDVEAQKIPWESYAHRRIRRAMLRLVAKERKEFLDKTNKFDENGYQIFESRRASVNDGNQEIERPDNSVLVEEEVQQVESQRLILEVLITGIFTDFEIAIIVHHFEILREQGLPALSQSEAAAASGVTDRQLRNVKTQALMKLRFMILDAQNGMTLTKTFEKAMDNAYLTDKEYAILALRSGRWGFGKLSWEDLALNFAYAFDLHPVPSINTIRRILNRALVKLPSWAAGLLH